MVEADHPELSIAQQCTILGISRSSYYYKPKEVPEDPDLAILEAILEVLKERPFYGYRRIARELACRDVTRKQIRRIMKKAGLRALYPGLQLSKPAKGSKKYPYLLKGMNIWLPNQVWASDITYIKLSGGYVYLVTILTCIPGRYCLGGFPTPWMLSFVYRHWKKLLLITEYQAFSIRTREVSLLPTPLCRCWNRKGYRSAWMASTGPWIISL